MKRKIVEVFLLSAALVLSIACDDKKPERVEKEVFTVTFNNPEGGYDIVTCEDGDFVASDDEIITTHLLDATESGRCYRVLPDYVDGFITPPDEREILTIGNLELDFLLASTPLGSFILLFATGFGILITLYSLKSMAGAKRVNEFYGAILLTIGGSAGILLSNHLLFL